MKNDKKLIKKLRESLVKRALGYEVEETKDVVSKITGCVETLKSTKWIQSDSALIFLLCNLDEDINWKRTDEKSTDFLFGEFDIKVKKHENP